MFNQLICRHPVDAGVKGIALSLVVEPCAITLGEGHKTIRGRANLSKHGNHGIQVLGVKLPPPKWQINGVYITLQPALGIVLRCQTFVTLEPPHANGQQVCIPNFHGAADGLIHQIGVPATIEIRILHTRPLLLAAALFLDFAVLGQLRGPQVTADIEHKWTPVCLQMQFGQHLPSGFNSQKCIGAFEIDVHDQGRLAFRQMIGI